MTISTQQPAIDVRFPTHEIMRSPYAFYEELRRLGPLVELGCNEGEFVATCHSSIKDVAQRSEVFSNVHSVMENGYVRRAYVADDVPTRVSSFITTDPPRHTKQRKIAFHPVKPGRLRGYEQVIRRHADQLIDAFAERGEVELVSEFCNPLPAGVIGEVLNLPVEDRPKFIHWSLYEGHGARYETQERRDAGAEIVREMGGYVRDAVMSRYEQPQEDIISDLIRQHAERDGEPDLPNLIGDVGTLLIGGIVTSSHMMASAMTLLQRNPDQLALVQADQSLILNMLEEAIRVESPVQWQPRLVREDTEVEGIPVPADSIVLMLFASANRDPDVFPDPERFDVTRRNARDHLGFGYRTHFCLGAPLARLEGKIAFERLFARLPNLRLGDDNDFAPLDSLVFRGPQRLHLKFDAA